jgi:hypothetical protein
VAVLPKLLTLLLRGAEGWHGLEGALRSLDAVALYSPGLATQAWIAWGERQRRLRHHGELNLEGRPWLVSLPGGLELDGSLKLRGAGVTALPKNLRVSGSLDVRATPLTVLPEGLWIGTFLDLRDCAAWDGRLPHDAHVGRGLLTPGHSFGVTLSAWRGLYPDREV